MLLSDERAALNFRGRAGSTPACMHSCRLPGWPLVPLCALILFICEFSGWPATTLPHARHDSPRHMQHATRDVDKRITRRPERRAPSTATAHRSDEGSSGEVTLSRSITLSHLGVAGAVTCISSFESASLHASVDFALFAN